MEENMILDESVIVEDVNEKAHDEVVQEKLPKIQPRKKNEYKEKKCKVIGRNRTTNTLNVNFDGYGIVIKDVEDLNCDTVTIRYKGEIGKPNFEYKL